MFGININDGDDFKDNIRKICDSGISDFAEEISKIYNNRAYSIDGYTENEVIRMRKAAEYLRDMCDNFLKTCDD